MNNWVTKLFGTFLIIAVFTGCQGMADKMIDSYMERKGTEVVETALNEIIKKRSEKNRRPEPTLEERMKNRVDVSVKDAPIKGDANAPITIVEFSDFECPFCDRANPTIAKVMKEYKGKVKLAFRHNPLPFHKNAKPAAKAAMAAHRQGKFWEMHDKLFAHQRELTPANFEKFAKELKLDLAKFKKDMADPALDKQIDADAEFARSNQAGGTPSFFIDGVLLVGAQPFEAFQEVIDALLKQKG